MAKKKVAAVVRIQIEAGAASPAPPVGTALGPHGIAIMDFCKAYNEATQDRRGQVVPAEITIFEDRSFTFITKTPPTSFLIRKAAGLEKASTAPGRERAGRITRKQAEEIADTKMPDLNAIDREGAIQQVIGTARSMGIEVSK
ncbi:MAG TPA: 50S ribosomal protein L11 [Acidimicrobiia bacterium]|nr:50S ribosomal protein L11 [Acidimicrobiia bacterium]